MPSTAIPTTRPLVSCADAVAHRSVDRRRLGRLALASSMVVSFLAASAAPTPLYDRYEALWHATPFIGTIAFGIYAFAVLVGLLWLGELAVFLGRRPVFLAALAGQGIALVLFATAGSFAPILVGRAVQGLAAGIAIGALSATMIESDPERGAVASAASPSAGSGLGAILSGVVVQFLPGPTHTVYLVLLAVMLVQALGVVALVDGVPRRPLPREVLRPRIAVPARARATFAAGAPIVFAAWSFGGFAAALSPALYVALSGDSTVWHTALPLTVLAGAATLASLGLRRASGHTLTMVGGGSLVVGLAIAIVAVTTGSVAGLFASCAIAGIGFGTGLQGPIRALAPLATDHERPGLLSAVFLLAYVGLGLPAVIAGALVSAGLSLTAVATGLAVALGLLAAAALVATVRTR